MKNRRNKILIALLLILLLITSATFTLGKYAYNNAWNYYLTSKGFYFESDMLSINTKKNSVLKWDGSDVYFEVKNSQNDKMISEYDISYKITCEVLGDESEYINCSLNGIDDEVFQGTLSTTANCINSKGDNDVASLSKAECEVGGYTWSVQASSKKNHFNLKLTDPTKKVDEVSVKITAESITPYHQILIGVFNLNRVESTDMELITVYNNYSEYNEVTITNTTTQKKCVYVTFDTNKYLIDTESTDFYKYEIDENNNVNKIELKLDEKNSKTYKFFKLFKDQNYSVDDFEILEKEC